MRRAPLLPAIGLALLLASGSAAAEDRWALPWVIARASWDAPWGPGGGASVFVHPRWSVSVDVSKRSLGVVGGVGVHHWPACLRIGRTHDQVNIGVGGGTFFSGAPTEGGLAVLVAPLSFDLHYIVRFIPSFGVVLGTTAGVGVTFSARDFGAHPRPISAGHHVGVMSLVYGGVSFGNFAKGTPR